MIRVFPPRTHALINAALNRLVPAGSGFPGAGDLSLIDALDRAAGESPATARRFVEGVRQIGLDSEQRHGRAFEELDGADQDAVLRAVEGEQPAFFESFVRWVYVLYYSHPAVIPLLGLETRPPQPLGHALPPFHTAMTAAMRTRAALFRQVSED